MTAADLPTSRCWAMSTPIRCASLLPGWSP